MTGVGNDGKSAFGVSEVAIPKRSFKRGVVRGDGGSSRRDDGKSVFGASEVALPKRSFQRGVG